MQQSLGCVPQRRAETLGRSSAVLGCCSLLRWCVPRWLAETPGRLAPAVVADHCPHLLEHTFGVWASVVAPLPHHLDFNEDAVDVLCLFCCRKVPTSCCSLFFCCACSARSRGRCGRSTAGCAALGRKRYPLRQSRKPPSVPRACHPLLLQPSPPPGPPPSAAAGEAARHDIKVQKHAWNC